MLESSESERSLSFHRQNMRQDLFTYINRPCTDLVRTIDLYAM